MTAGSETETVRWPVHGGGGGLESMLTGSPGTALLAAIGCPTGSRDGEHVVVPAGFERWGVAIMAPTALLGSDGALHGAGCVLGETAHSPGLDDLLQVSGLTCRCHPVASIVVRPSAVTASTLKRLLYDIEALMRRCAPERGSEWCEVLADVRSVRLSAGLERLIQRFTDATVPPPQLEQALSLCRRWLREARQQADSALADDGLLRLGEHMSARFAAPTPPPDAVSRGRSAQRGVGAALKAAEAFVPGANGDHVLCMFDQPGVRVEAAIAAARIAASSDLGAAPFGYVCSAAVLPGQVAVLLHADWTVYCVPRTQSMVFAAVVDPHRPGLEQACEVALTLWSGSHGSPEEAWQAALAFTM